MLILSRYQGQAIFIGDDVTVVVASIQQAPGRRPVVKLGIEAPRNVVVIREEIERKDGASNDGNKQRGTKTAGEAGAGPGPCVAATEGCQLTADVRRPVAGT